MKRTIILRYVNLASILGYAAVLAYFIIINQPFEIWFSAAVSLLGINVLLKGWFFELDSCMYLASFLIFVGIASYIQDFFMIDAAVFYPWYIFALAFASLMVFSIFRQKIHLKLFVIVCIEVLLLFLYKFFVLPKLIFYVINSLYLLAILLFFINSIRKNAKTN